MEVARSRGTYHCPCVLPLRNSHHLFLSSLMLGCGVHRCPLRCHPIDNHSEILCKASVVSKCSKHHPQTFVCHVGPPEICAMCERNRRQNEKRARRLSSLPQNDEELARIDASLARETHALREIQSAIDRRAEVKQRIRDLDNAKRRIMQSRSSNSSSSSRSESPVMGSKPGRASGTATPTSTKTTARTFLVPPESLAGKEWQRQKDVEGTANDAIDAIVEMVGLEEIKSAILDIKATIDLATRQGTSITRDRYNICMLGNPGTGALALRQDPSD